MGSVTNESSLTRMLERDYGISRNKRASMSYDPEIRAATDMAQQKYLKATGKTSRYKQRNGS
jgi:hypothetical protein